MILKRGSTGPDVRTLQAQLAKHGYYRNAIDGDFGPMTEAAVRVFQSVHRLAIDGVAGPITRAALGMERQQLIVNTEHLVAMGATRENAEKHIDSMRLLMPQHGIDTPNRVHHFLAQIFHESGNLRNTRENMNYSAARLLQIFPRHFTQAQAREYQGDPERIANRAYAGRNGNGPETSGDGWRYRGRGLIQLTGRRNYYHFAQWVQEDVIAHPERVAGPLAVDAAVWYWVANGLNELADQDDIRIVTRVINGGYHGIEDRRRLLTRAREVVR
jgi:predicted chitinase